MNKQHICMQEKNNEKEIFSLKESRGGYMGGEFGGWIRMGKIL